ncbi:methyltransferase small [Microseira wollei NIES-4236]|uniref:tRNA1(Val) (adenine(37)-N6)-methyltransferase n=1 Tax=Microseira wollei NIES-4236 TaxID=2530354 RepID=A0AAV3XF33_9CYAN|nr:methyltransferase [Microseira wollei]GET39044.1 methyltransferase small [Microseira wollei NIES-4236]
MKVGTDGVLLGAWTDTTGAQHILDIGTGTGLLALMLAQRSLANIDAVEIDADACIQARENVTRSPFWDRIGVYQCSIQDYATTCSQRYDLLVSNPPFFENAYKTPHQARTLARHSDRLEQVDLLQAAEQLLSENGRLAVIYPSESAKIFPEKAEAFGFFCHRKLYVKPTLNSPIKRVLIELGKNQSEYQETTLTIEADRHIYTAEFIALIKDFYLKY